MRIEDTFDFRAPDYVAIFKARAERLQRIRETPALVSWAKAHYREDHLADFITDWGCLSEPRNVEVGQPAFLPFILWPRQREFIEFVIARWRGREDAVVPKSRDSGVTWLAVGIACSLCMLYPGVVIGFGSRKLEYVDKKGAPKSIFEKIRAYMRSMPSEFTGGWNEGKHSPEMRCFFPATGSVIVGEVGDEIGRGDRCSIYFVDEAAFLEHPSLADHALSQTTNCRIDISTPNGMANSFATKCHNGTTPRFDFHWRMDSRKDDAWYAKQVEKYDPVTIAQEVDMSFTASVEGIIIQPAWVQAAIDAHKKLGISPTGVKRGALDVADEGKDVNAFVARHGILVTACRSWSGKNSDIFATTERAFLLCDELGLDGFDYDADGLGAGVRGDSARIMERRRSQRILRPYRIEAFRGSGAVFEPERKVPGTDVLAKDRWQNAKAQGHGSLAERFRNTYRAVNGGDYDPDNLISLSSDMPDLSKVCIELSQPQWKISGTGKMMVDKTPDGAASPNLADAVMMAFAPKRLPMRINPALLQDSNAQYSPAA